MAKYRAYGSSSRRSSSSTSRSTSSASSTSRNVSAARLSQKSGSINAFGGYTKVNSNGTFRMRKTGK